MRYYKRTCAFISRKKKLHAFKKYLFPDVLLFFFIPQNIVPQPYTACLVIDIIIF